MDHEIILIRKKWKRQLNESYQKLVEEIRYLRPVGLFRLILQPPRILPDRTFCRQQETFLKCFRFYGSSYQVCGSKKCFFASLFNDLARLAYREIHHGFWAQRSCSCPAGIQKMVTVLTFAFCRRGFYIGTATVVFVLWVFYHRQVRSGEMVVRKWQ